MKVINKQITISDFIVNVPTDEVIQLAINELTEEEKSNIVNIKVDISKEKFYSIVNLYITIKEGE